MINSTDNRIIYLYCIFHLHTFIQLFYIISFIAISKDSLFFNLQLFFILYCPLVAWNFRKNYFWRSRLTEKHTLHLEYRPLKKKDRKEKNVVLGPFWGRTHLFWEERCRTWSKVTGLSNIRFSKTWGGKDFYLYAVPSRYPFDVVDEFIYVINLWPTESTLFSNIIA